MTQGALQRLGQGDRLVTPDGGPTSRLQVAWQELAEALEQAQEDVESVEALLAGYQPLDGDLTAIAALAGTGLARRTGTDAWSTTTYEEFTFTPGLRFGGATTGITYSSREGGGLRIGNRVIFECTLILTSKGTATGAATVTGPAFNAISTAGGAPRLSVVSSATSPSWIMVAGGSIIQLQHLSTGTQANLTDANFANNSSIVVSGSYRI